MAPNGYNKTPGGCLGISQFHKTTKEEVEQIKFLLKNTDITQRDIAREFNLSEDFIFAINKGLNCIDPNETYPLRKRVKKIDYCQKCGKEITPDTIHRLCRECYNETRRIVSRPDKFQLAKEIACSSFCAVGRKYGVTDNAIRKWCKLYDLPIHIKEIKTW